MFRPTTYSIHSHSIKPHTISSTVDVLSIMLPDKEWICCLSTLLLATGTKLPERAIVVLARIRETNQTSHSTDQPTDFSAAFDNVWHRVIVS